MHDTTRRRRSLADDEEGSATAEYAIATMAAVGFAGHERRGTTLRIPEFNFRRVKFLC